MPPSPLELELDTVVSHELPYQLDATPRSSLYSVDDELKFDPPKKPQLSLSIPSAISTVKPSSPPAKTLTPSIRLLFSLVSVRDRLLLLVPAILFSVIAGGIAPFMTYVIGQVFNSFAQFPLTSNPPQSAKQQLLHDVGISALELVSLSIGSIALSSMTSSFWIWIGERNVMALRKRVYAAVTHKDMAWFDSMGADSATEGFDTALGAGGLMAKFTKDTDDVRMASSLASGMLVQYLTTCITCLLLAFTRSWALTLVILSAVPLLTLIQTFSQAVAGPLLATERAQAAVAGTLIERVVTAIATVKAFNAVQNEEASLDAVLSRLKVSDRKLNAVWGLTSGFSQFVMMGMFVQGFWFGSKLVRDGKIAPGDVMAVFWACLIATSNLQMCIPQSIVVAKGKFAVVSLLSLLDDPAEHIPPSPSSPGFPRSGRPRSSHLRKIVPSKCYGEITLHDVTFAYPSRPTVPVLQHVSLYLAANETTFIVGGSGSGKSTIAQLLLRMYTPQSGSIHLDDQDISFLDEAWTTEHLASVSQGCILFDMSVHDNVAIGVVGSNQRDPKDVSRDEVAEACTAALMHEFVRDLPDGYETKLGTGGANLSGGQKQRLAIARAQLRNPSVLILDEATSALDPTSRILVFEAIKRWRSNKTTIVITHDLSQISASDFVYVLKEGRVAEQGFRYDLENSDGEFHHMMLTQQLTGGHLPTKRLDEPMGADQIVEQIPVTESKALPFTFGQDSLTRYASHRLTSNWMFDVVAELTAKRDSTLPPHSITCEEILERKRPRPTSIQVLPVPSPARTRESRRYSLQFTPTSSIFPSSPLNDGEKMDLQRSGTQASARRNVKHSRTQWNESKLPVLTELSVEKPQGSASDAGNQMSFFRLLHEIYPTIPYKPLLYFGFLVCLLNGAMTPIFSFLLSRLLFEVSIGAQDTKLINTFGGIVLTIAALDGILLGSKYFIMESCGMNWVARIRRACFKLVLAQDKKWFDKSENNAAQLVQLLVKDGDDARSLIAVVLGQCLVVGAMLSVGLIWALVQGWQLTLVGFAIAPIFAATMALQSRLVAKCELRNKRAREDIAKAYYESIVNVRGIRSLTLDKAFQQQFDNSTEKALSTGIKGAFVEGCTYGVASGLIYLAEALLFYVGAVLVSRGTYTYLQMVQVLNLVVFTVTIGSQLLAFTTKIAKSVQATRDFQRLLKLPVDTDESKGTQTPPLEGHIAFSDVDFSYPERPNVAVLNGLNLHIDEGECVAIVGSSGSGKSTVASLLQRLYEPAQGRIHIGMHEVNSVKVEHLRQQIAVVSQNPYLFNATISENIVYGNQEISQMDIRRAAKAAHAHEFIMSLPNGYDTLVGENASQISGGQAQRLALARALARPSKIMVLDECTSALDPSSQAAVIDSICKARAGRTIVLVTHKLPIMQICDRIIVIHEGRVAEHGSYSELLDRKGLFFSLANGGEWE